MVGLVAPRSRRLAVACCLVVLSAAVAAPVQAAAVIDVTESLSPGDISLAAAFEAALVNGTPLSLGLFENVGLAGGLDLYAREGFGLSGSHPFLLGVGVKWTILTDRRDRPGLALWVGGHYWSGSVAGADSTLVLEHHMGAVTPYAGIDAALDFYSNDTDFKLGLLGGARIALGNRVGWFVEAGLGLLGVPHPHYIATGPRVAF